MKNFYKKILAWLSLITLVFSNFSFLATVNAADANFSVANYTSWQTWYIEDSKFINASLTDLSIEEEKYFQIELAEGMRFNSFIWNDEWWEVWTWVLWNKLEMQDWIKN